MKFAVIDLGGDMAAGDLEAYAAAQQEQLQTDFAPLYDGDGLDDIVRVVTATAPLKADEVAINLHKTLPDDAPDGALGIHGVTAEGVPVIDVYRDLATKYGDNWQSIASHEVIETRVDPRLHACVELDDGTIWDHEACDRVEADSYEINGVPMSNFNTPQCFEPAGTAGEWYDFLKKSDQPNQIRPGGYAQQFIAGKGWVQHGEMRGYREELARLGLSRGARRRARGA